MFMDNKKQLTLLSLYRDFPMRLLTLNVISKLGFRLSRAAYCIFRPYKSQARCIRHILVPSTPLHTYVRGGGAANSDYFLKFLLP